MKNILDEALLGDATRSQRIVIWRTTILALFVAHMFWAAGIWLPGAEAGFVTKQQFGGLEKQVQRIEINQIAARIEIAQERVCKAALERNNDAVRYAVKQRNEHVREYRDLTHDVPVVPSCHDLGLNGDVWEGHQ